MCAVCRWQTVLYTWLNLNRRLNFVLCSPIATHLYTWLEQLWAVRIILGHFRHTPDTIDGQPRIARSQISMFWSELNSTKTVGAPPWRSKTVVHCTEEGKLRYSISGSSEIQGMARGYSFDIRFTLRVDILRIFRAWFSFLVARAHLLPNQGSSRLALVSRLKLDRVSLMGIRVEFETKCQCLYWSEIKSLWKQIQKSLQRCFIPNPFLGDKRWVGFGTNCFLPPDFALTDSPATGRLLICCSSL